MNHPAPTQRTQTVATGHEFGRKTDLGPRGRHVFFAILVGTASVAVQVCHGQFAGQKTYCNPVDINYQYNFEPKARGISYRPGGFMTGAGHGNTFQDTYGNYWNTGTPWIAVNFDFERRIALFPAGFDKEGLLYANTRFGDFPHYLPTRRWENKDELFTGWMLLSYRKPCVASSTRHPYAAANLTDENPRSLSADTSQRRARTSRQRVGIGPRRQAVRQPLGSDSPRGVLPGLHSRRSPSTTMICRGPTRSETVFSFPGLTRGIHRSSRATIGKVENR